MEDTPKVAAGPEITPVFSADNLVDGEVSDPELEELLDSKYIENDSSCFAQVIYNCYPHCFSL